jgi:short-subunit dehydrogenase
VRSKSPVYTWIIGASSGIGEALAYELARQGETIALSARNGEALSGICAQLKGAGHLVMPVDASDAAALFAVADNLKAQWGRIDRIIFMAGLYTPMKLGALDLNETAKIINVNLMGAFNATEAGLRALKPQGKGQLVLCASVAGYRGLPNSQPYGATKAAVINLATSLRLEHGHYLDIKVINPGFVTSRLTQKNDFEMPFKISPEKAAKALARGLKSKDFEIHFPKQFTLIMKTLALLPDELYFKLASKAK